MLQNIIKKKNLNHRLFQFLTVVVDAFVDDFGRF